MGDLVTQQQSITKEKIADIMEIGTSILLPYWRDLPTITITSINVEANGNASAVFAERSQDTLGSGHFFTDSFEWRHGGGLRGRKQLIGCSAPHQRYGSFCQVAVENSRVFPWLFMLAIRVFIKSVRMGQR